MADPYANMNPLLAQRIQALINGAAAAGFQISPGSGFRTMQEQIALRQENGCPDIWNSPASACRIPTAIPGSSNHQHGLAIDLNFHGNQAAAQWANQHGAQYGIHFPVHGENWHAELLGNDSASSLAIHDAMHAGALGTRDLMTSTNPTDELTARFEAINKMMAGGDFSGGKLTADTVAPSTEAATIASPEAATLATPSANPTPTTPAPQMSTDMPTTVNEQVPAAGAPQQWGGLGIPPPGFVPAGKGAERWAPVAAAALKYTGQDQRYLPLLLKRLAQESGGNNEAVNNWDSNAMRGDPTTGLMQNIPSAWQERAQELAGRGITDGFANIVAAIRYTLQRYGTLSAWARRGGY